MTPSELVARFRLDVDDDQAPYLWSDAEVWGYLNDAIQKWLGVPGGGVRDASTAAICDLAVTAADPWLELSPLVTKIRSARLVSTGRTLRVITLEELFGMDGMANDLFPVSTDDLDLAGTIKALVIGMEDNKLRAVRIPDASDTVKLVVERLSKYTHAAPAAAAAPAAVTSITRSGTTATVTTTAPHGLAGTSVVLLAGAAQADYVGTFQVTVTDADKFTFTVSDAAVTPATGTITWAPGAEFPIEVDAQYHLDLLLGMKALAYSKQDADTFDKTKADEADAKFVARATNAALDKARREHKPRLMTYGGI